MNYATLNDDGIVTGVSQLSGEVDKPNMMEIEECDTSLMGKKWDGKGFVVVPKTKKQLDEELIQAEIAKIERDSLRSQAIASLIEKGELPIGYSADLEAVALVK